MATVDLFVHVWLLAMTVEYVEVIPSWDSLFLLASATLLPKLYGFGSRGSGPVALYIPPACWGCRTAVLSSFCNPLLI